MKLTKVTNLKSRTMLRHHHDVATGTSIRQTYLRRLCDVSLVRK